MRFGSLATSLQHDTDCSDILIVYVLLTIWVGYVTVCALHSMPLAIVTHIKIHGYV